jgi:hypothetical protein
VTDSNEAEKQQNTESSAVESNSVNDQSMQMTMTQSTPSKLLQQPKQIQIAAPVPDIVIDHGSRPLAYTDDA